MGAINYETMIADYRERVKFTLENLDTAYEIGRYQYCILVLQMVIDIGNQIQDYETVSMLRILLDTVINQSLKN